jgi:hypothetical protein
MLHVRHAIAIPLVAAALGIAASVPAEARIRCDGNFQIVNGQPHATPFCQDENLARVARSYGMRVSGDAMRHSPSAKQRVCAFLNGDIRVREACHGYGQDGRGGGFIFRF